MNSETDRSVVSNISLQALLEDGHNIGLFEKSWKNPRIDGFVENVRQWDSQVHGR